MVMVTVVMVVMVVMAIIKKLSNLKKKSKNYLINILYNQNDSIVGLFSVDKYIDYIKT